MNWLVEIEKLSVGYKSKTNRRELINDFTATINKGDRIAILGLNGCGKTSLLKTLMKENKSLGGFVKIQGKYIDDLNSNDFAKLLASVNTSYRNPGQVVVKDLIGFGRYPFTGRLNKLKEKDFVIIEKSINLIGIKNLEDRFIDELSDGERQKVMLACAIAQNTPLLILDEPTSHLDVRNKVAMMQLIKDFSEKESKTILFTTHDLRLAKNVANRIWLIHDKKVNDESSEAFVKNKSWKPLLEGLDEDNISWL